MRRLFEERGALAEAPDLLFAHPYWPVAFATFFSDPLLEAMFGPDATQHAAPGSYTGYFQRVFERGLLREDARDNPFLHHVLLGHYLDREGCLPHYLASPAPAYRFAFHEARVDDSIDLAAFDFVNLSNILDWMSAEDIARLFAKVRSELRPDAVVMWRQLNNERELETELNDLFDFDTSWQRSLLARDRSLFY